MKKRTLLLIALNIFYLPFIYAQDQEKTDEDCNLEMKQDKIKEEVKEELKDRIKTINKKLDDGEITQDEAEKQKKAIAEQKAKNIEERQAIARLFFQYAQRNDMDDICEIELPVTKNQYEEWVSHIEDKESENDFSIFKHVESIRDEYNYVYYSRPIINFGFNNTFNENDFLGDPNHKFAGSRYFEFGWEWSRNIFKKSNRFRFDYGISLQYNGIKPKREQIFVENGEQTELQSFGQNLDKSKFRMTNLIFPMHLEITDSNKTIKDGNVMFKKPSFKIGLGGFVGVNIATLQKLKYEENNNDFKSKERGDFNTKTFIYGLNVFVGSDNLQLFGQYNLNSVFSDNPIDEHNFQLGIRLELGE